MTAIVSIAANNIIDVRPWLEFGVACGATLRQLAEHAPVIYGFDSFEGLPEDWCDESGRQQEPRGKFRCNIPDVPKNAHLVLGFFETTLPGWLDKYGELFGLVHIDCDLYSSTKFVLEHLEPYLDGTVIAFDEIRGFPAGEHHEGRAWREFLAKNTYNARLLGHQHNAGAIYKLSRR